MRRKNDPSPVLKIEATGGNLAVVLPIAKQLYVLSKCITEDGNVYYLAGGKVLGDEDTRRRLKDELLSERTQTIRIVSSPDPYAIVGDDEKDLDQIIVATAQERDEQDRDK